MVHRSRTIQNFPNSTFKKCFPHRSEIVRISQSLWASILGTARDTEGAPQKQANPRRKLHGKRNHKRSTRDDFCPQLNIWVNWLVFQEKCTIAIIPPFLSKKETFQCDPNLTSRQNRVNGLMITLVESFLQRHFDCHSARQRQLHLTGATSGDSNSQKVFGFSNHFELRAGCHSGCRPVAPRQLGHIWVSNYVWWYTANVFIELRLLDGAMVHPEIEKFWATQEAAKKNTIGIQKIKIRRPAKKQICQQITLERRSRRSGRDHITDFQWQKRTTTWNKVKVTIRLQSQLFWPKPAVFTSATSLNLGSDGPNGRNHTSATQKPAPKQRI